MALAIKKRLINKIISCILNIYQITYVLFYIYIITVNQNAWQCPRSAGQHAGKGTMGSGAAQDNNLAKKNRNVVEIAHR